MKPGVIYLYAGKVEEWIREWKEEKNRESLCGRLLLLCGLQELGYDRLFSRNFNISHSGGYGVCAISSMPCGVDIQEKRAVRSQRMIERTMNAQEQRQILEAEDSTKEFIKLWTYKESCIKLSGEGLRAGAFAGAEARRRGNRPLQAEAAAADGSG